MTDLELAILEEQALSDARIIDEAHVIECARCEIELGEGRFKCRRAKGTDICLDCAYDMDTPVVDDDHAGDEPGNTFKNAITPFAENH